MKTVADFTLLSRYGTGKKRGGSCWVHFLEWLFPLTKAEQGAGKGKTLSIWLPFQWRWCSDWYSTKDGMGNIFQESHFLGTSMQAMEWGTERVIRCREGDTLLSIGTGAFYPFILTFLPRFLKQWVLVWNGHDGRIYISSAPTLADRVFEPARVLIDKANDQEKNWWVSRCCWLCVPLVTSVCIRGPKVVHVLAIWWVLVFGGMLFMVIHILHLLYT